MSEKNKDLNDIEIDHDLNEIEAMRVKPSFIKKHKVKAILLAILALAAVSAFILTWHYCKTTKDDDGKKGTESKTPSQEATTPPIETDPRSAAQQKPKTTLPKVTPQPLLAGNPVPTTAAQQGDPLGKLSSPPVTPALPALQKSIEQDVQSGGSPSRRRLPGPRSTSDELSLTTVGNAQPAIGQSIAPGESASSPVATGESAAVQKIPLTDTEAKKSETPSQKLTASSQSEEKMPASSKESTMSSSVTDKSTVTTPQVATEQHSATAQPTTPQAASGPSSARESPSPPSETDQRDPSEKSMTPQAVTGQSNVQTLDERIKKAVDELLSSHREEIKIGEWDGVVHVEEHGVAKYVVFVNIGGTDIPISGSWTEEEHIALVKELSSKMDKELFDAKWRNAKESWLEFKNETWLAKEIIIVKVSDTQVTMRWVSTISEREDHWTLELKNPLQAEEWIKYLEGKRDETTAKVAEKKAEGKNL